MIANGADVNVRAKGSIKRSPIIYAAAKGSKEIVEVLLANGADVNAREQGKDK